MSCGSGASGFSLRSSASRARRNSYAGTSPAISAESLRRGQHPISGAATGDAVRKAGEQGKQQSIVVMTCLPGRSSEAEKLIGVLAKALIGGGKSIAASRSSLLASRAEVEHGGDAASVFSYASVEGFDEDAREAWRQRKTRESLRHAFRLRRCGRGMIRRFARRQRAGRSAMQGIWRCFDLHGSKTE